MRRLTGDKLLLNIFGYLLLSFFAIICFIPLLLVISSSFTSETYILNEGYSLIPRGITLDGYRLLWKNPDTIIRAYGLTTFVTVVGTMLGLFFTTMAAYVIQRKDFEWGNKISFYFFFTTLFSGGLVPWYILLAKYLHFTDSVFALILPPMIGVFYILLMKGFMRGIPDAISESAKMDGAGDFTIFIRLILPMSTPALATIGLFIALNYWNDWYHSMLFMQNSKMYSLQYYLYSLINNAKALERIMQYSDIIVDHVPVESMKMSMTIIVTGPIVLLYPFVQKYFIRGIALGAVKG